MISKRRQSRSIKVSSDLSRKGLSRLTATSAPSTVSQRANTLVPGNLLALISGEPREIGNKAAADPLTSSHASSNTSPTLAEIVKAIRSHQSAQSEKDLEERSLGSLGSDPRSDSQHGKPVSGQYAAPSQSYNGLAGSYAGYGADHPVGSVYSQPAWYAALENSSPSKAEQKGGELSAREMDELQEDAKLKVWGLGGSGKHVSLRTQEVYSVLKCMVGTSALNMSRYMLALC